MSVWILFQGCSCWPQFMANCAQTMLPKVLLLMEWHHLLLHQACLCNVSSDSVQPFWCRYNSMALGCLKIDAVLWTHFMSHAFFQYKSIAARVFSKFWSSKFVNAHYICGCSRVTRRPSKGSTVRDSQSLCFGWSCELVGRWRRFGEDGKSSQFIRFVESIEPNQSSPPLRQQPWKEVKWCSHMYIAGM